MRRKTSALIVTTVFISLSSCFAQSYKWNNSGAQLPSGITHSTYHSSAMNVDIGFNIYLPPNYNTSTDRYPVIYSLHGMGGNENSNCNAYRDILQNGINGKQFPAVIVVFVNGRGNTFYSDSKDGTVKCETTIMNELIKHIDATYRTKADRAQRAIEGISMGGFGTLMLGFKHPETFSSLATYDAALVTWDTLSQQTFDKSIPNGIFGNDRNYFNENSYPTTFAKKNAETIKSLGIKVRMITGDQDKQMGPLYNYNLAMKQTLTELGINLDFKVIPGGKHGDGMNSTTIKENLIFHTQNFSSVTGVSKKNIPLRISSKTIPGAYAVTSLSSFELPHQLRKANTTISVYDLNGRNLGIFSRDGITKTDEKMVQNKTGSGVYLAK